MQEAKDNVRTVPDGNQAFELQRQTYNKLNQDVFLNRYVTDQSSTHFVKNCSTSWCFSIRCQLQGTSRQVSLVTWSALQAILKKTSSELCCYRAVTIDRGNEDLDWSNNQDQLWSNHLFVFKLHCLAVPCFSLAILKFCWSICQVTTLHRWYEFKPSNNCCPFNFAQNWRLESAEY